MRLTLLFVNDGVCKHLPSCWEVFFGFFNGPAQMPVQSSSSFSAVFFMCLCVLGCVCVYVWVFLFVFPKHLITQTSFGGWLHVIMVCFGHSKLVVNNVFADGRLWQVCMQTALCYDDKALSGYTFRTNQSRQHETVVLTFISIKW